MARNMLAFLILRVLSGSYLNSLLSDNIYKWFLIPNFMKLPKDITQKLKAIDLLHNTNLFNPKRSYSPEDLFWGVDLSDSWETISHNLYDEYLSVATVDNLLIDSDLYRNFLIFASVLLFSGVDSLKKSFQFVEPLYNTCMSDDPSRMSFEDFRRIPRAIQEVARYRCASTIDYSINLLKSSESNLVMFADAVYNTARGAKNVETVNTIIDVLDYHKKTDNGDRIAKSIFNAVESPNICHCSYDYFDLVESVFKLFSESSFNTFFNSKELNKQTLLEFNNTLSRPYDTELFNDINYSDKILTPKREVSYLHGGSNFL